jgi:hypothetical protein
MAISLGGIKHHHNAMYIQLSKDIVYIEKHFNIIYVPCENNHICSLADILNQTILKDFVASKHIKPHVKSNYYDSFIK